MEIVLIGAGLIGRRHAAAVRAAGHRVRRICDPVRPDAGALAGADWSAGIDLTGAGAAIVATPNALHEAHALACIRAGVPLLVEKPLADGVEAGARIVVAAEAAGVPLLAGHHRRHDPIVAAAKARMPELGRLVALDAQCWLGKPEEYFEGWRVRPGAGPLLINAIHDLDLMRHLGGEVVAVSAALSHGARGLEVEDTAALLLRFASDALGTLSVSDAAPSPWSWELSAGENPAYPQAGRSCYRISGTQGSLSVPDLTLWRQEGWWAPITAERAPAGRADALTAQVENLVAVSEGRAAPLCSGADGLAALRLVEAARRSAASGRWEAP